MNGSPPNVRSDTQVLLGRLRAFCFPGGEDAARLVRAIRTTQRGEMRSSPGARWMPFTAAEVNDTTRSSFRWDARFGSGGLRAVEVTGATVDLDIGQEGRPLACRADRPRIVGKKTVLTPWSGICVDFNEWEGLRVASRIEVVWQLPEGPFTYFKSEVTSFIAVR